ncbi:Cloroperoxidase [Hortaea werneckii]|nr:Cloroperoxidase [Hortaea werneckii]KAI7245548.1 Cloroperoxidase [Hortaea werneckii]KAI7300250.1 Cloroperoxidase [Hortaea werneckii]KAI7367990.1 Cloroperoxidase [Hortaea werneckii]KAI7399024.1 Cloroperoxidase [Hortaea werneckii]
MYLGFVDLCKSYFIRGPSNDDSHITNSASHHQYIRGDIQNRGPCPALNALANHGYLPRDGKNMTIQQVEEALMTSLHQDKALASAISRPLNQILRPDGTFDLVDMRRHNYIEHDASLTRLDARHGDNYTFQPAMFQAMLKDARGGPVTVRSLARSYNRRKKERKADGGAALPWNLWFVNIVQTVSFLNTADTGGRLTQDVMIPFYEEERIPETIFNNSNPRTLVGLLIYAAKLIVYIVLG